jgi:RNA polymerase sigma-70 factor, ECF subfamily
MAVSDPFEDFVRSYQNMVYSTATRLLGSETEAADIAQEVFLKAHVRFEMLTGNPAAGGWLKTVTTNLSLNHLTRYRARWRFFSEMLSDHPESRFEDLLPSEDSSVAQEDQEHRRHYLEAALRKLPSAQRVPLVLYHFEEMSYEAIAEKLGVSLSKVKTDIHRGRESLRRWLTPDMDQWEKDRRTSAPEGGSHGMDRTLFPWPPFSEEYSQGQA